jgi:hypothetical protein
MFELLSAALRWPIDQERVALAVTVTPVGESQARLGKTA